MSLPQRESTLALAEVEGYVQVVVANEPQPVFVPHLPRDVDQIDPEFRSIVNTLVSGQARWPLFVHGPAGVGKTRAALCLCDRVRGAVYTTVAEVCDRRIKAMRGDLWSPGPTGGRVWESDIWSSWARSPLVLLDEIGTRANVSDHQFETVKRCIDEREAKPAVFVSNLSLANLAVVFDDRVASRLAAGTVFKLDGQDRRLEKSWAMATDG